MYAVSQLDANLWRITLPKPFLSPLPVARPNNVYLITGPEGPALINAGHPGQVTALAAAVRDCGVALSAVERVIVTSWSMDHLGAVARLGHADVFVMSPDMLKPRHYEPHVRTYLSAWRHALEAWLEHAQPEDAAQARERFDTMEQAYTSALVQLEAFIPVRQGHVIRAGGLSLEVWETPGPNQGHVCLWERERRWLFSGELTLDGLPERVEGVRTYLRSLAQMKELEPERLFPSYGEPVEGGAYALLRPLRFLDNFLTNAPLTLSKGPSLFEFVERDLGLAPRDHVRYAATLLSYRAFLEELGRSGVIDVAGEGFARRYGVGN